MARGSSNIILRDIFNEVNSTTHNSSATIANCDLDAIARDSVGTRAGGAAWSANSYGSLVMDDWAGYEHSGTIGDITYLVNGTRRYLGEWSQTDYGLYETALELGAPDESTADGGIYLYTKQVSGQTWLYADRLVIAENDATTEGRRITGWSGNTPTYDSMGSSSTNDGTGADVIVKIDTANIIVTCTVNIIHGWGDVPYLSGKDTPSLPSGHTYVANSAQGAGDVNVSGASGTQDSGAIYRMQLGAHRSGYASTGINFDVAGGELAAYSYHHAVSDEEEE